MCIKRVCVEVNIGKNEKRKGTQNKVYKILVSAARSNINSTPSHSTLQ